MNHNHINISDWETISSAHVDDGNFGQYLKLFGDFFCMYIIGIHTKFYGNSSKIECFTGQKPRPPPAMALTVLNLAYFRSFMSYNVFFAKCVHLGCIK